MSRNQDVTARFQRLVRKCAEALVFSQLATCVGLEKDQSLPERRFVGLFMCALWHAEEPLTADEVVANRRNAAASGRKRKEASWMSPTGHADKLDGFFALAHGCNSALGLSGSGRITADELKAVCDMKVCASPRVCEAGWAARCCSDAARTGFGSPRWIGAGTARRRLTPPRPQVGTQNTGVKSLNTAALAELLARKGLTVARALRLAPASRVFVLLTRNARAVQERMSAALFANVLTPQRFQQLRDGLGRLKRLHGAGGSGGGRAKAEEEDGGGGGSASGGASGSAGGWPKKRAKRSAAPAAAKGKGRKAASPDTDADDDGACDAAMEAEEEEEEEAKPVGRSRPNPRKQPGLRAPSLRAKLQQQQHSPPPQPQPQPMAVGEEAQSPAADEDAAAPPPAHLGPAPGSSPLFGADYAVSLLPWHLPLSSLGAMPSWAPPVAGAQPSVIVQQRACRARPSFASPLQDLRLTRRAPPRRVFHRSGGFDARNPLPFLRSIARRRRRRRISAPAG